MPLTPTHLGPGLFLGMVFSKFLDLPAILIASIFPDIEPALVVLYNYQYPYQRYPHHGILHSFLAGVLASILIAVIVNRYKKEIRGFCQRIAGKLCGRNLPSLRTIFFSALLGYWVHILFDAIMHYDLVPFWPIKTNPFLRIISFSAEYEIVILSGIIGLILLSIKIFKSKIS